MGAFGHQTDDGYPITNLSGNEINFSAYQINEDGIGKTIYIKMNKYTSGSTNCKCAIYDNALNFIAGTEIISVTNTLKFWGFNFTTEPLLTGGSTYYLAIWYSAACSVYAYSTTPPNDAWYNGETFNGWPDPLTGTSFPGTSAEFCIYCIYAAANTMTLTGNLVF